MRSAFDPFVVSLLFTIAITIAMGWAFITNFGSSLPISCDRDNLCENQYTRARYGYDDRFEGTMFSCMLTDCCYNNSEVLSGVSWELCMELNSDDVDLCRTLLASLNPEYLFDCVGSRSVCNEPNCYESCNYNGECEDGEFLLCEDCW